MKRPNFQSAIDDDAVRKEWHNGEWHYSAIDMIKAFFAFDRERAKNYYHVTKGRLIKNGELTQPIIKLKTIADDGKKYFTDFLSQSDIQVFEKYLEANAHKKHIRVDRLNSDEVICFHPKVQTYLASRGWLVSHHVKLKSGNIIDFVAKNKNQIYILECKPRLSKAHLFTAIGQVLAYCCEYESGASPAIVSYTHTVDEYARKICNDLAIELIGIDE